MNTLMIEGVFWRIVNQIYPDLMMAQYSYDPSAQHYRKMKKQASILAAAANGVISIGVLVPVQRNLFFLKTKRFVAYIASFFIYYFNILFCTLHACIVRCRHMNHQVASTCTICN